MGSANVLVVKVRMDALAQMPLPARSAQKINHPLAIQIAHLVIASTKQQHNSKPITADGARTSQLTYAFVCLPGRKPAEALALYAPPQTCDVH